MGHSVALYCQNHRQIQELEAQLAQYGYRDLFAPLPPENPLDMLEVAGSQDAAGSAAGVAPGVAGSCRHVRGFATEPARLSALPCM